MKKLCHPSTTHESSSPMPRFPDCWRFDHGCFTCAIRMRPPGNNRCEKSVPHRGDRRLAKSHRNRTRPVTTWAYQTREGRTGRIGESSINTIVWSWRRTSSIGTSEQGAQCRQSMAMRWSTVAWLPQMSCSVMATRWSTISDSGSSTGGCSPTVRST